MPYGCMGKILWVDLSSGSIEEREVPAGQYRQFGSGMGLGARVLYDAVPAGADPLGPDNVLGLVSGLLTGTGARMAGRWMAVCKSPLTGGWGEANGGGFFSPAIKRAGYDGVFFSGASEKPVYLAVSAEGAELRDASHLWGLDTIETEARVREETDGKKTQVACIGPAGERLSLLAGIVNDGGRIAARSGVGAVMGSKRLKAVALSGKHKIEAADPARMKELAGEFNDWIKGGDKAGRFLGSGLMRFLGRFLRVSPVVFAADGNMTRTALRKYGTIVTNIISSEIGDSPVKNWKGAGARDFPMSTHSGRLDPTLIVENQKRRYHCYSCPTGCGGVMDLEGKTRFDLAETHKPEYETCAAFGSLILNNDLDAVYHINHYLNRMGMDTIGAGASVAFAMECFEQGALTSEDLGGLDLSWGNSESVIELVRMMVEREGIGDALADGSKAAAKKIGKGSADYAIHAGGQDLPMHDTRMDPGLAVAYNMEPAPGRHTNYSYMFIEMFALDKMFPGLPSASAVYLKSSRENTADREVLLAAASKFMALVNSAGLCLFSMEYGGVFPLVGFLNAATGWGLQPDDYLALGERVQQVRQAFNIKHGVVPGRDFKLPRRVLGDPPMEYGPLKGARVPIDELNKNFTRAMGWDPEGRPSPERLRELGLAPPGED